MYFNGKEEGDNKKEVINAYFIQYGSISVQWRHSSKSCSCYRRTCQNGFSFDMILNLMLEVFKITQYICMYVNCWV